MEKIEEMSLADVITKAEGLKTEKAPVQEPVKETPAVPEVVPAPSVATTGGNWEPSLKTPEPDPSWPLEMAQAHEAKIQEEACNIVKRILQEQGIPYEEVPSQPFTLKVGELIVQNIIFPWESNPRVVAFKGIRIICPDHLDQRVDAFRRKRRNGAFNFRGLIDRIKQRLAMVKDFTETERAQKEVQNKLQKLQEEELSGVKVPQGMQLTRAEDGTYSGSVNFSAVPLKVVKDLVKVLP